ncbi:MAG: hypothetical protein SFV21_12830 [Rhodospirillaceae bacterium]|nr:hypothetical protein [Rhodospirillaceae bacterium]
MTDDPIAATRWRVRADRARAWLDGPGKPVVSALRWLIVAGVLAFLAVRAGAIGWQTVLSSLPRDPWFYAALAAAYLVLPAFETVVHGFLWRVNLARHAAVFVVKKVYNFGVLGYSGEAFLFAWARNRLGLSGERAFAVIKDNTILSAMVSNTATVALTAVLLLDQGLRPVVAGDPGALMLAAASVGLCCVMLAGTLALRRMILSLAPADALVVIGLHTVRLGLSLGLQATVWAVALPSAPFEIWLLFLTVYMVLTRIPFLPNKDLLFIGVGVGLADVLPVAPDEVARVLLVTGALTQGVNLAVFAAAAAAGWAAGGRRADPPPAASDWAASPQRG